MKLNRTQLIHRIGAIVKGQVTTDCMNALIVTIAGIFETCGNALLRISIAGTLSDLTNRMLTSIANKGDLSLTPELQEILIQIVDRGPVHINDVAGESPAQTIEDMTKCGLIARITVQGDSNYVAATYNGNKLRLGFKNAAVQP